MPPIVDFETIPQLYHRLQAHYAGQGRTVMRFKNRKANEWVDISWEELDRQVQAMAGYLYQAGVRFGDRVAILSENRPEWAVTDLATQLLGAVNVSIYTSLPASQVAYIIQDSGTKVFIVSTGIQLKKAEAIYDDCPALERVVTMSELRKDHRDYVETWDDAFEKGAAYWKAHEADLAAHVGTATPGDLSALIYTSGTTGNPKGVMLTHHNFCSNARSALGVVDFTPADHHLSFLPLCHSFERTAGYTCVLAAGAKISYAESIDAVSKNLPEVNPTVMISVPRLFERVFNLISKSVEEGSSLKKRIFAWSVQAGTQVARAQANGKGPGPILKVKQSIAHKLVFARLHEKLGGNLRFAVSGGAALPKAIGEFFRAAGITIIEGYGLTETAPVLAANPLEAPRYGTVGHILPGVIVAIQRLDNGEIIGQLRGEDYPSHLTTEEGEIIVKGPNVMKGYWNDEASTRESIDADGWYHTGDVGRFEDGYLCITDRIKHMIVSAGGKNIYPGPIEEQFKTNPWIDQVMIVGEAREFLTALVVPNLDTVKAHAREKGLAYADPEAMLAQDEIRQLFEGVFRTYSRSAAAHEKVRNFRLIADPFTVENGFMTPTLKLKRRVIEQAYEPLIEEMYAGVV